MKVMEIAHDWGLHRLVPGSRPDHGPPGFGQVLVHMQAASINYRDYVMANGGYGRRGGRLPMIPVSDGAGQIVALGPGVTGFTVGDLACPNFAQDWISGSLRDEFWSSMLGGITDGVLQETMLLPASGVVKVPSHLEPLEAATLPCAALTAWNAITSAGVKAGSTVLTQGTGGVSLFALQFAKMFGAAVIVTSSNDAKLDKARRLGADEIINYTREPRWESRALEIAGQDGIDLVIDLAGSLAQSVKAVRTAGTVATIGVLAGPSATVPLGQIVTRAVRLQGVTAGSRQSFEEMVRAIDRHRLRPVLSVAGNSMNDAPRAIAAITEGKHFGKLCIHLRSPPP
jgi:NADPH:quinone reductase-like Zn-dependent oxidoreductase